MAYVVTPHLDCLVEMVQLMGHNFFSSPEPKAPGELIV